MSKYTTLLRWPIEQKLDDLNLPHQESSWPQIYEWLGLGDYPIFDEVYRPTLNDKIIRRYYFREIGFETFGLFKWYLRSKMFEIMPYYNQMYESQALVTEPLLSFKRQYGEEWNRNSQVDGNTTNNETVGKTGTSGTTSNSTVTVNADSSSNTDGRTVVEETPMNLLDSGAVENLDYATEVTYDKSNTGTNSNSTTTSKGEVNVSTKDDSTTNGEGTNSETGTYKGDSTRQESGFDKSQAELLLIYRKTFVNIDLDVVDRLSGLFMGLW